MPAVISREQLDRLYQQYRGDVYRYALFLTRDANAAEDITQEVFLRIASGCAYEERASQKGWMLVVTKHVALDHLAKIRRLVPVGDEITAYRGEDPLAGLAVYEWIHCLTQIDGIFYYLDPQTGEQVEIEGFQEDHISLYFRTTPDGSKIIVSKPLLDVTDQVDPERTVLAVIDLINYTWQPTENWEKSQRYSYS